MKMDERLFFAATQRNKEPIAEVLSIFLPKEGNVLEIASGSGEHGIAFQEIFQNIIWQTSDIDPLCRKSISSWINQSGLRGKMPEPLEIDVQENPWPLTNEFCNTLRFIACINMIHISPISATRSLFANSGEILKKGSRLFLYGPFKREGSDTSISNKKFDQLLKAQNEHWGIRDLEEVTEIANENSFKTLEILEMPANNLSVIFQKAF